MKALSLRQPYAELILQGKKTMESRLWKTKYRGEFLIHASVNVALGACKKFGFDPEKLTRGFIVGEAVLVSVKEYPTDEEYLKDSDKHLGSKEGLEEFGWAGKKKYGFLLENVKKIEPVQFKGQLNFFETGLKFVDGKLAEDRQQKTFSDFVGLK